VPRAPVTGARVSTQTGVEAATNARSTASERPGVSVTPCEPTAPGRSAMRKKIFDRLRSAISSNRSGWSANQARMPGMVPP
jgi:hypothetical protein